MSQQSPSDQAQTPRVIAPGTYRLTKLADNEGGYHLWRYGQKGWAFAKIEHGPRVSGDHAYLSFLSEDDEYTYWK